MVAERMSSTIFADTVLSLDPSARGRKQTATERRTPSPGSQVTCVLYRRYCVLLNAPLRIDLHLALVNPAALFLLRRRVEPIAFDPIDLESVALL